jgi:hypothetical protein
MATEVSRTTDSPLLLPINSQGELAICDLRSGGTSVVPLAKNLSGYWIDQTSILVLSADNAKFVIFDLRTQKWTDLATVGTNGIYEVSPDGKYAYYETWGDETPLFYIAHFSFPSNASKHKPLRQAPERLLAPTGSKVALTSRSHLNCLG